MNKLRAYWHSLTSTLWFVPTVFVIGGILLGFFFIEIDVIFGDRMAIYEGVYRVQPSGARDMLAVIASSAITVAGTVFSITIVALTLASTQFSPRILRNFMGDTGNQSVLGAFIGIFAYCLIVLRTIRDGGDNPVDDFVPSISVLVGTLLGLVGIGCLIYFIHHVATSIQATNIISLIADETIKEIQKTFPVYEEVQTIDDESTEILATVRYAEINSTHIGYIQSADTGKLKDLAEKHDLILKMQRRVGQFAIKDLPLLHIFPKNNEFVPDINFTKKIQGAYFIGNYRTVEGDAAFGLRQIVDIALKALSPAINDTTTALICVDYLSAILCCLAKRPSCSSNIYTDGKLRLIIEQQRFEDFFDLAFNQIRQNAGGNVAIILRQLGSINVLSKINTGLECEDERRERHELMETQMRLLNELAKRTIEADADLKTVERYYSRIEKILAVRNDIN